MAAEDRLDSPARRAIEGWAQVVVVGGGPAGAIVATLLARASVRVALRWKRSGQSPAIGEVLPPAARPTLVRLGLGGVLEDRAHLRCPGTVSAWGSATAQSIDSLFSPYGDGLHLDRARFDAQLLASAEAAGARVIEATWDARDERWDGTGAGGAILPVMVDCTGRAAAVARAAGAVVERLDALVAVAGVLSPRSPFADTDARTYLESVGDGWWYSALLPDGRRMAAFHTDADLLSPDVRLDPAVWQANLFRTNLIGPLVRDAGAAAPDSLRLLAADSRRLGWPPKHDLSGSVARSSVRGPALLAVGDSAMAFDPLSSQGILSAIQSAEEAVPQIQALVSGDVSAAASRSAGRTEAARERWSRYVKRLAEAYADERRWPDAPFWERRHGQQPQVQGAARWLSVETVPFGPVDSVAPSRS